MAAEMTVPVTPKMAEELASAARLIKMLDSADVSDKSHFVKTVDRLEALTMSVLGATTSVPLTSQARITGARFQMGSPGHLNNHVIECVSYLRDTASEHLSVGGFQQYSNDLTDEALSYLRVLESMIRAAIVKTAESDLSSRSSQGIAELLSAATALATATATPAHREGTQDYAG